MDLETDRKTIDSLEKSKNAITEQSFNMQRSLDGHDVINAIRHASLMVNELRTDAFSPKIYYELYGAVFEHLHYLESSLLEKPDLDVTAIYEIVQYAPFVLPRLYLLITIGSIYIKLHLSSPQIILKDITRMCCGVKHPVRGLFLRHYLVEMARQFFPLCMPASKINLSSPNSWPLNDCLNFLVKNFASMNKLWVRMQHLFSLRDKEQGINQRNQLVMLVGKNISYLTSLDCVDARIYRKMILPRIGQEIVSCHDTFVQDHLLIILIQVVGSDWHYYTSKDFIKILLQLELNIDVKNIINSFIGRLSEHMKAEGINLSRLSLQPQPSSLSQEKNNKYETLASIDEEKKEPSISSPEDMNDHPITISKSTFGNQLFADISDVVVQRPSLLPEHALSILNTLMQFFLDHFPDEFEYIKRIFDFSEGYLRETSPDVSSKPFATEFCRHLRLPLSNWHISDMANIPSYYKVFKMVGPENIRLITLDISSSIIKSPKVIDNLNAIQSIFKFVDYLFFGDPFTVLANYDTQDLSHDVEILAAVISKFYSPNHEDYFSIILQCKNYFTKQKANSSESSFIRLYKINLMLIFSLLRLVNQIENSPEENAPKNKKSSISTAFKYILRWAEPLEDQRISRQTLGVYLLSALAAFNADLSKTSDIFIEKSLLLYENHVSSSDQYDCWKQIMSTLCILFPFSSDFECDNTSSWSFLVTNCCRNAKSILSRTHRAIAIAQCSHMYWAAIKNIPAEEFDPVNLLKCLDFALTICSSDVSKLDIYALVHLLNQYIYFQSRIKVHDQICHLVKHIGELLCKDLSEEYEHEEVVATKVFFNNTLKYIEAQKLMDEVHYIPIKSEPC